jgi:cell wall-associated NlpC family hydrolase
MRAPLLALTAVLVACQAEPGVGTPTPAQPSSLAAQTQAAQTQTANERPPPTPFLERPTTLVDHFAPPDPEHARPATKAAAALIELADTIDRTRTDTAYSHATRVRRKQGIYHFDCSGMINWMLERVAPTALAKVGRERPVASSYVRVIENAPTDRAKRGWQRIADIEDVRPGDLFAWRRPASWPKGGNTGHVGIVLAKPEPVPELVDAYVVRILDSTRWAHQYDSRSEDETGFGTGTILVMTDGAGKGIGYGWHGTASRGWNETDVVFGRISK